ncbi:MAG: NHLP bacteriocin system secretion protein [Desulfobacteraceae bacterium]|nr:NHLP bacteriocin system secretion protein [Desulfobacteraceae bacterium]
MEAQKGPISQSKAGCAPPQGFTVVRRCHWTPIAVFLAFSIATIAYLLLGKIAITAKGEAMFLTPETVVPFEAKASGQIKQWHVRAGDRVNRDQLLATLDQPMIEKKLALDRQKLVDVEEKNKSVEAFMRNYIELERLAGARKIAMMQERAQVLKQQIAKDKDMMTKIRARKHGYIEQHEKDLRLVWELNRQRARELEKKLRDTMELRKQTLRSEDQLLTVRQESIAQQNTLNNQGLQLIQVGLDKAKAEESSLDSLNRIADMEASVEDLEQQIEELVSKDAQLEEQLSSTVYGMKSEANELRRTIAAHERNLRENQEVRSELNGHILELSASVGKLVVKGGQLGIIDTRRADDTVEAVAYFKLAEGKKIKPGMTIRLTPATVQRERFGSILAKVQTVSSYPVTTERVAKVTGNPEVASYLTRDERQIEVYAHLLKDEGSFSGFRWNLSTGPETQVTAGTLASAIVDIEERAPISFVIPLLKKPSGK